VGLCLDAEVNALRRGHGLYGMCVSAPFLFYLRYSVRQNRLLE
jgi:hypothetical protein